MAGLNHYLAIMSKYIDVENKQIRPVILAIGEKTNLKQSLEIAKGLIDNYFLYNPKASEEILKLIDKQKEIGNPFNRKAEGVE